MKPWQFSKPKTPGFGISGTFYLSILSSRAVLPSIVTLVNPEGSGGAVIGFGAPLVKEKEKSLLGQPMQRGAYVVATKDRKTILKMLIMSRDEAHYDPETYTRSEYALGASPELIARMRATWSIAQLTFESHDPAVYPAIDFFLEIASRMGTLTEGVIADPTCQRYLLPDTVRTNPRLHADIDARETVSISLKTRRDGTHAFTLGLKKFDLPELEMIGLQEGDETIASNFLMSLAQTVLQGGLIKSGDRFGSRKAPFEAREGGFDTGLWSGTAVMELLPPTALTTSEALAQWSYELKNLTV